MTFIVKLPENSGLPNDILLVKSYTLTIGDIKKAIREQAKITQDFKLFGPKMQLLEDDSACKTTIGLSRGPTSLLVVY